MDELSDFFKLLAQEKKHKKEEFDSLVGNLELNSLFEEVNTLKKINKEKNKKEKQTLEAFENFLYSEPKKKIKTKKEEETKHKDYLPKVVIVEEEENKEVIVSEKTVEEPTLIEKSLGLLAEPLDVKQQNDPLTPLDQKFATLDDLHKHYSTFLTRIQQQLSTLGGGGETRLEFLDDVDRDSAKRDNYFLKYDATINKWIGDDGGGVGITSIVFITGITTYYSATKDVDYIGVSADVPVTIDLPISPAAGKQIIIKDEGNKISTYNVTVRAGIGASVENNSSVIMKINHESFTYFYNGYNWYIV